MRFLNPARWHGLSLRRTLLLALLPGMLVVFATELFENWRTATQAADAAYDRSLLGAIKSIDANISTASGGIGVELPYRMLEFFELTANGRVFYRVATEDGLVEIGNDGLPPPLAALQTGKPEFQDAVYFGEPVRVGSYARLLDGPFAGQAGPQRVVIQVAETLDARSGFKRALLLQSLARDVLLGLAAATLLMLAIAWALRPLARLRSEVLARTPQDLTPISAIGAQADVRPLVDAINQHIARNRQQTEAQRRFVDDASHQLRTPLTTLATQVGFALRASDPATQHAALQTIKAQLDETVRQTNQMLSLARTDSAPLALEPTDLVALAREVTRSHWAGARASGIDLGFEAPDEPLWLPAQPSLLREALLNLLHNALRYTPSGGQVTVRVWRSNDAPHQLHLGVEDDGPGIPAAELAHASERFFRGSNTQQPGTGLGLAIVQAIAERHGASLQLAAGPGQRGLSATLVFASAPA